MDTREVFEPYRIKGDKIDFLAFIDEIFATESSTSYFHIFKKNNMGYLDPCANAKMKYALDLQRIRNGEPKYMLRELFSLRYKGFKIPNKTPMPRAVNVWLREYAGPRRDEFIPNCVNISNLNAEQKWQLYCLESFLNYYES